MSEKGRFHYSLEPVLKTRQWARDALQADLLQMNDSLKEIGQRIAQLTGEMRNVASDWTAASGEPSHFQIDKFTWTTNYLGELSRRLDAMQKTETELERKREDLIDQVATSQREVEAVERHRDGKRADFMRAQASDACKAADDQWNTLQLHGDGND